MPTMKGYCTNCNRDDEPRRIFDVNSDARWCYCPHCGKKYRPSIVINNYRETLDKYNRKAYFYLRHAGEYLYAYNLFAYVLELEPSNKTARLGRLLSLANLSTTRRNRFEETKELLDIEKEHFRQRGFEREYHTFLISLNSCLDVYIDLVRKNLTIKGYFYDVACVKLYYRHLSDVINLKRTIAEEYSMIYEEKMSAATYDSIKELEKHFNDIVVTADGQDHYLVNFNKNGEPLVANGRKKIDTKLSKYRLSTLDEDNKKLNIISETVFTKVRLHTYHAYLSSLVLALILFAIFGTLLILYFVFAKQSFSLILLTASMVCALLSVSFIVLRFICLAVLKKPKF